MAEAPTLDRELTSRPQIGRPLSSSSRFLRAWAAIAFALGVPTALVGFATGDPKYLAFSAAALGVGFVLVDTSRSQMGGITPITLYALSFTLASCANLVGLLNQDSPSRSVYFLYALDEFLPTAMRLSWLGLVIPVLAFRLVLSSGTLRAVYTLLPKVEADISDRMILPLALGASVLGFGVTLVDSLRALGTIYALLGLLPHLAAFVLARGGIAKNKPNWVWIALCVAVVVSARAALFAYLRSDILLPIFAYAAGLLVGAKTMRVLRRTYFLPVYGFALVFVAYFAAFGEVRSRTAIGIERLSVVDEARVNRESQGEGSYRALIARMSNFNQLTQVSRVVREDGLYQGQTLEYLAYAWIPRFLWPDKPLIAKGAWFAHRIGQARLANGKITNSVNMTIPGELYLNYGWTGVILGLMLYGTLMVSLWLTTRFWSRPNNVLGTAFGFYLLWTGVTGGADLQIMVTLVAAYLLFWAAGYGLRGLISPRPIASENLLYSDTFSSVTPPSKRTR